MKIVLRNDARKYVEKLDSSMKRRIKSALDGLAAEPPRGDIKAMSGVSMFRLRVGAYRILFSMTDTVINVVKVAPRGEAYKGVGK